MLTKDYHHEFNLFPPGQHQQAPAVVVQPVSGGPVEGQSAGVVQPATVVVSDQQVVHQHQPVVQHHQQQAHQYYSPPAGMITVVGGPQQQSPPTGAVVPGSQEQQLVKPGGPQQVVSGVRNYEQYGQPESAGLPPNYKPFGSWGLYIGGNPADGYYTNYYKALTNSVEKQQTGEPVKPVGGVSPVGGQTAALSPMLRQAGSSPYVGGDFYSFAYSPSDLNSGVPQQHQHPAHAPGVLSNLGVFGAPVVSSPGDGSSMSYGVSPYADAYATKKIGAAYAQKEVQKEVSVQQQPSKGYQQSRVYLYPSSPAVQMAAPVPQAPQQHNQQSVVAYPVPVGSQIVGSQPGVEGAFGPYGVHAFTRYAVKPTVLNQDASYYYSYPSQQQYQALPAYKQQVYNAQQTGSSYYPFSFYGYPLSQLHYSQGSITPESMSQESPYNSPEQPMGGPGKLEVDEKLVSKPAQQQQKRA